MHRPTAGPKAIRPTGAATSCVAAALLLITCGGVQQSPHEPSWPPDLEGEWRWVETVELRGGETRTPASEGFEALLHLGLTGAEAAGRYEYFEAGELVAEGEFDVAFEEEQGNDFLVWRPPFAGFHEQQWLTLSEDTLRLRDATAGGLTALWVRVE